MSLVGPRPDDNRAEFPQRYRRHILGANHRYRNSKLAERRRYVVTDSLDVCDVGIRWYAHVERAKRDGRWTIESLRCDVIVVERDVSTRESPPARKSSSGNRVETRCEPATYAKRDAPRGRRIDGDSAGA